MPRKIVAIHITDNCEDCRYFDDYHCKHMRGLPGVELEGAGIPDWCPLDDYPDYPVFAPFEEE
jgi:hypothetical protein